jgi:hypothetical protein
MSDLIGKIGLALEAFKGRQQDIIGLGHRAYKDLFTAANSAMLTYVVQNLIQQSIGEMVTSNPPRTSLLAAVSQQHSEIMAGFRVLTEDEVILRALVDAANAATVEGFRMIYSETPKTASSTGGAKRKSSAEVGQPAAKTAQRSRKKTVAKRALD